MSAMKLSTRCAFVCFLHSFEEEKKKKTKTKTKKRKNKKQNKWKVNWVPYEKRECKHICQFVSQNQKFIQLQWLTFWRWWLPSTFDSSFFFILFSYLTFCNNILGWEPIKCEQTVVRGIWKHNNIIMC